jgi:hypothetical protein
MTSYEPGEEWFWDFFDADVIVGMPLADPQLHPEDQPTPGPEGRVPPDWESKLNG